MSGTPTYTPEKAKGYFDSTAPYPNKEVSDTLFYHGIHDTTPILIATLGATVALEKIRDLRYMLFDQPNVLSSIRSLEVALFRETCMKIGRNL